MEPYEAKLHKPVYMPQPDPDIIFIVEKGTFKDKRIHALDQKTNSPDIDIENIIEYF